MKNTIPMTPSEERSWALLVHLSGLAGVVFPFGNIIAPVVLWIMRRERSAFVDDQGREAINFQISFTIYAIVSAILIILLIGIVMLIALGIAWVVLTIIAAVRANEGVSYRYPMTLRLIK